MSGFPLFSINPKKNPFEAQFYALQEIGDGVFSRVFSGELQQLITQPPESTDENTYVSQTVAFKIFRGIAELNSQEHPLTPEKLQKRFTKELHSLERAQDISGALQLIFNDIVTFSLEEKDQFGLLTEYVPGKTLYAWLNSFLDYQETYPTLTPEDQAVFKSTIKKQVLSIVEQILSFAKDLHAKGLIHKDFKLENFILDETGIIKAIDFGLSRPFCLQQKKHKKTKGSPEYIATEYFDQMTQYAPSGDMWALGCMFFSLLTGSYFTEALTPPLKNDLTKYIQKLSDGNIRSKCSQLLRFIKYPLKSTLEILKVSLEQPTIPIEELLILAEKNFQTVIDQIVDTQIDSSQWGEDWPDLIKKLLKWNPKKRLSAKAALKQPLFFKPFSTPFSHAPEKFTMDLKKLFTEKDEEKAPTSLNFITHSTTSPTEPF